MKMKENPSDTRSKFSIHSLVVDLRHEIRSPLNSIINMAELALKMRPEKAVTDHLQSIESCASRLLSLLDDIMDVAEDQKSVTDSSIFYLTSLLEEVRESIEDLRHANGVVMALNIDDEMPECFKAPRALMRYVLTQLLDLAIRQLGSKYITLKLQWSPRNKGLVFTMEMLLSSDDAEIDREILKGHKFALCSSLLKEVGSGLDVYKEASGVVFTFAVDAERMSQEAPRYFPQGLIGGPFHIAMVNSDGFSSEMICRRLAREGFSVRTEVSVKGAAGFLAKKASTQGGGLLCILNCQDLKEREDKEIEFLRKATGISDLPVIIVGIPATRMMEMSMAGSEISRKQVGLVMKPFGGDKILAEISRIMGWAGQEATTTLPQASDGQEEDQRARFQGLKVLVVEDDRINQQILLGILKDKGIKPVIASTGSAAKKAIQRRKFHAIFMDIKLPDDNGYELTLFIRENKLNQDTPVIALTASTSDRKKCLDAGMNDFLTKPYSEVNILKTLAKWTGPDLD